MRRRVVSKGTGRRTVAGQAAEASISLDDRPLALRTTRDGKRLLVTLPYELWVVHAESLEVEKAIELPLAHPTVFEDGDEGVLWLGGVHLRRGALFSGSTTKVGTKLGGFVDHVCSIKPHLLCGVGPSGEVLWDTAQETEHHRRRASDHAVYGLVASADGRAVWIDGSSHAWVIDPEHASGYMKLKLRTTSPAEVDSEGLIAIGSTPAGATVLAARDGAIAWTNRALRIVEERFPKFDTPSTPLAMAADEAWIYVLRPGGTLQRFGILPPDDDAASDAPPPAQTTRLSRPATCIAVSADGSLLIAGPHSDEQLGRLWREAPDALTWEPLRLGRRELVEPVPEPEPEPESRKPDFTPVRSKIAGRPIAQVRVDDVLAADPAFWVTRSSGNVLERPTTALPAEEVLPGDALLLPCMLRLHTGTARPGLLIWPGVPKGREVPQLQYLTWGDDPRGWLPLTTPALRTQGWPRREVFPLQVACPSPAPEVPGDRPRLPARWNDRALFDAMVRECKKLLQVVW